MRFRSAQDCTRCSPIAAVLVLCLVPLNAEDGHANGARPSFEHNLATGDLRAVTDRSIDFPSDEQLRWQAKREDHELVERCNGLMTALRDFASTYNAGHVIDVRKVRAVQKAIRQLEKSEWFRSPKER